MYFTFENNSARGLIETIFSLAVIIILLGIFTGIWVMHLEETRKIAFENQLTNLKYSLELYIMVEGHYPDDLRDLNKRCKLWEEDSLYGRRYLELQVKDEEGYPIDPYGLRFIYDNKTGEIKGRIR